jgi:hypothetical protein
VREIKILNAFNHENVCPCATSLAPCLKDERPNQSLSVLSLTQVINIGDMIQPDSYDDFKDMYDLPYLCNRHVQFKSR